MNRLIKFNLPIENSLRTLISYEKLKVTNSIYPRKYNEIKKKEIFSCAGNAWPQGCVVLYYL